MGAIAPQEPAQEARHRNFNHLLVERFGSNQAAMARALNRPQSYVWQLAKRYRNMGERAAREIEQILHLARGTLDRPQAEAFHRSNKLVAANGTQAAGEFLLLPVLKATEVRVFVAHDEHNGKQIKKTLKRAHKQIHLFEALTRLSAPGDVDVRSFYFTKPDRSLEPLVWKGERALIDTQYSEPHDGWIQLIDAPEWPEPKLRVCSQHSRGEIAYTCAQGRDAIGWRETMQILGTAVSVLRELEPGPRDAAQKKKR